jgi:glycosyltransferase involved in cell wall biosynthesis
MKVLFYLDSLGRGGAETQALDACRNAERFGLEIVTVTGRGGPLETEFARSGLEVVRLERRFPVDLYMASQIRRIVKERSIDVVHGHQAVDGLHLHIATRGLRRVRKVLSFHGFIPDRKNRLTLKYLIPRMDANVVVSRGLREWLKEHAKLDLGERSEVIYTGADPERLKPSGRSIREEIGAAPGTPLVGMVGNFYRDPRKDQLTVIKAMPSVVEAFPSASLVFAGDVENGAEDKFADCVNYCIGNNLTERVHFLGARSDVPDILSELDVFVFSSLQEGLPVAASEAMLAGVAMVISDIGPLLEATGGGKFAEVFPVGNVVELSERIRGLVRDDDRRLDLAKRAKDYALENFSIDAHLRQLKKLYTSLFDNKNQRPR